ncbi:hypothetical protein GCM10009739_18460 [Microbacterium ulmi]|uniref:hypothetical protein n=1 Tax=Microbacterium ulmi TaxID=179095 RepID=UPI0031DB324E
MVLESESVATLLTVEQSAALADEYRAGAKVTMLAVKYGVHRQTMHVHLKRHGVARPLNILDEAKADRAARLYADGMTLAEVAAEVGSNTRSITLALEARSIPRRPRGLRAKYRPDE